MSIVSIYFFLFLIASLVIYYIFPKKYRWTLLLVYSLYFFYKAGSAKMLLYLSFTILTTYVGGLLIHKLKEKKVLKVISFIITLLCLIIPLFIFKYINFIPLTLNLFTSVEHDLIEILAPLGISYYTLSLISYVVDIFWGSYEPQKNPLKHALFSCYYPSLISGPIIKYSEMKEQFFEPKKINWDNIFQGFYRIIYGLMKKVVIADALASFVSLIFNDYTTYSGIYIIIGLVCYAFQIYMDFSGCMDIVIGASQMYNVILPENFKSPFFSKNLSEFWRRWHISLGTWGKEYLMYPILKTKLFQKLGAFCKKIFGKKLGKKIPTILSIFVLWLLIGIWHGASFKYVFAAGMVPWVYLTVGELFDFVPEKINKIFKINTETFSFRVFQSIRTIMFMCFVWLFVCAPSLGESLDVIKSIFIFADTNLLTSLPELAQPIFAIMVIIVFIVDYFIYNDKNPFEIFNKQGEIFKLCVVIFFIYVIVVHGCYGPAYNAVDFIYGGF